MKRLLTGIGLMILGSGLILGQSEKQAGFENADVHVSASGTQATGGFQPGGRVELRGWTMLELIAIAHGVDTDVVMGGPGWLNSDKFDIIAKAPAGASEEKLQGMLKTLLEDRFKLVAKEEKRDLPVYLLKVVKKGKLTAAAKPGSPNTTRLPADGGLAGMRCTSYTMEQLAELLPNIARNFVDHPVIDETGLSGSYDFDLQWMGRAAYNAAKANPDGPPAVGMFDAVEKLGLKLELAKRPQQVVVVDQVNQQPTPNAAGVNTSIPTFPTEFDVAEVRPAKPIPAAVTAVKGETGPPGPMGQVNFQNGRLEIMGATLKGLITLAWDTRDNAVSGPKWMEEDRFDVIAKAPARIPFEAVQVMLQNVLTQRFKLASHKEDQVQPVYVLAPGRRQVKLKESDGTARSDCKLVFTDRRNYVCQNTTMAQLAERLPNVAAAYVKAPLLDLTELKGAYDFELYWTPKGLLQTSKSVDAAASGQASTPAVEVTVFEAIDKQLGLKLEEQKHPMPVMVIDHAERVPIEQ